MTVNLVEYFSLLSQRLRLDLQAARLFISTTDKGSVNEHAWRQFLNPLLPARYAIGVGEIIAPDKDDTQILSQSEQKDVVIYDPFTSSIFGWGDSGLSLFPVESVYAVVEVKTCFHTSDDIKKAARQVYEVKRIQKKHTPNAVPLFSVVFAFSSAVTSNSLFETIKAMSVEERPDFVMFLGSSKEGEQLTAAYVTHWHYVTGGHGPIGFVTSEETHAAREGTDSRVIYLTLGETEHALLWFYLFFSARLQMIDPRVDKSRSPDLFAYTRSSEVDLGYRGCINKLLDRQRVSRVQISERTFRSPMKTAAYANEFIPT
jgi:Domain of unknown function (DUF6602)